jgi:hypothetical protein
MILNTKPPVKESELATLGYISLQQTNKTEDMVCEHKKCEHSI